MIITLIKDIKSNDFLTIEHAISEKGLFLKEIDNNHYMVTGDVYKLDEQSILVLPGVQSITRITPTYHLVSRTVHPANTIIKIRDVVIGDGSLNFFCGPCSVETEDEIMRIAKGVKEAGATILRGGAYKPRTSPYFFQGLGREALEYLKEAGDSYNLPVVSEIVDAKDLELYEKYVDIIQVGARNMQNYELLKALGNSRKPVLLKRGPSATIDELLMSAEYIMKAGNSKIILCERGIRTFEKLERYTLDLSSVVILKKITHLPVIVDPSHAVGNYNFVSQMALAAVSVGADGVMIEVHDKPVDSASDAYQAYKLSKLKTLIEKGREIKDIISK
ncbi:MAG: 3-deoxy-7-phosphoheptulonate synthase [Bacilli bacterium]|nr:3-deoxy-7-phosphoheptulonate synthase [Bacilli bacterium]